MTLAHKLMTTIMGIWLKLKGPILITNISQIDEKFDKFQPIHIKAE